MPADRLNRASDSEHRTTLDRTVRALLDVLSGAPLDTAAAHAGMEPTDLATAVSIYHQAGRQALEQQTATPDWWQLYVQFTDWQDAEKTAAHHLAPLMHRAETNGDITAWWFIRKHPCWRLRLRIHPRSGAKTGIGTAMEQLVADNRIARWWTGIYEPETAAFGGTATMTVAHDLFHTDSHAILSLHGHGGAALGRRELSILLCTILMRAAGLEWYEMGDVWHRVAAERPLPADIPPNRIRRMVEDLRQLMLADTALDGPMLGPDGPAAFAAAWATAFRRTGKILGAAAREGTLDRGLRHVLAYHVIFHWNRLGLPAHTQSVLAAAARSAAL
ncbi:thiopeptide-type bacteriocin biosynthesis protein [Streptomyces litchfieldiae]|uniref:Thiopeptide-type bacteriocin biosynthesis protein n=1 Tax=Streptomyces litchfieldiae TaxID=3075543 RepID=A0ABU2MZG1_9ACTN|nr:thiopeptide-type bacteriocin biosynthesis protein [Streptomyces sp. DSM 44938]MDT0347043.1 thiopeptide-type bacteriocin biosynthesis protein [Streptomyces sp. DSM 44938]